MRKRKPIGYFDFKFGTNLQIILSRNIIIKNKIGRNILGKIYSI